MNGAAKVNGETWTKETSSPPQDLKLLPAPKPAEGVYFAIYTWLKLSGFHFPFHPVSFSFFLHLLLIPAIRSIGT